MYSFQDIFENFNLESNSFLNISNKGKNDSRISLYYQMLI